MRQAGRKTRTVKGAPPLAEISQSGDDVCFFVEALVDPACNLQSISSQKSKAVVMDRGAHTTLSDGKRDVKAVRPSGEEIYEGVQVLMIRIRIIHGDECGARTRLIKMMRSSGTPCSMSTSTALIADPPVAVCMLVKWIEEDEGGTRCTEHRIEEEDVARCDVGWELSSLSKVDLVKRR